MFPALGPRAGDLPQLGDVIDKSGNVGAKFVLDPLAHLVFWQGGVLNGVVKKGGDDERCWHAHLRQADRRAQGVGDVRLAGHALGVLPDALFITQHRHAARGQAVGKIAEGLEDGV